MNTVSLLTQIINGDYFSVFKKSFSALIVSTAISACSGGQVENSSSVSSQADASTSALSSSSALSNSSTTQSRSSAQTTTDQPFIRDNWIVTASHNTGELHLAFDGDLTSRWSTKTAQAPNQWLAIEFEQAKVFNRIVLNSMPSANDYPREYEVAISDDGNHWQPVIQATQGYTANTIIHLDTVTARHIRIQQTGETEKLWWSIHELDVLLSTELPPMMIDGPEGNWTFCAGEDAACQFTNLKEVAYGTGDNWSYSIEIDGARCNSSTFSHSNGAAVNNKQGGQTCWLREPLDNWVTVRTLDEWRASMAGSHQKVRFKRGHYVATDLLDISETVTDAFVTVFQFDGSDNYFDMTGVAIDIPVKLLSTMPRNPIHSHAAYKIHGDNITLFGGTFINTYPNGQHEVTDFATHSMDVSSEYWPSRQMTEFRIAGNNTQLIDNTIFVRGSYPYGYGDMLGKGAGSSVFLRKHAGIQVGGDNTLIDGLDLTVLAFGHGIFMQGADNTIIRNSRIQGAMRLGADMYEEGEGSLPFQFNYQQQSPEWLLGQPIEREKMYNLTEDGIRAYTSGTKLDGTEVRTGAITVENTQVINMRGCITTPLASKPSIIRNVETRGCSGGFSLANDSIVENSRGDAAYGPLYESPYDTRRNSDVELTLINAPSTGDHPLARIAGSGYNFIFKKDPSVPDEQNIPDVLRPISVGDTGARWADDPSYQDAANIAIVNETPHPVLLRDTSVNITVDSVGDVTDLGLGNSVTQQ